MEKLIFKEKNIFILSKLVSLVRQETGVRHRMSNNDSIVSLLKDVCKSAHPQIKAYFNKFVENLTPEQIQDIKSEGVDIPEALNRKAGFLPTQIGRQYGFNPKAAVRG